MVSSMGQMENLLLLLVCLPLLGCVAAYCLGKVWRSASGIVATIIVAISFGLSCCLVGEVGDGKALTASFGSWLSVKELSLSLSLYFDTLSAVMCLVITGIGTLIHLYSIGYMSEDEGVGRFFSYLNLFIFAMLILVLGKNLPVIFIGWEGVGLCSYLLIGFWYKNPDFVKAGQKAFVMNRIGDVGFIIAMAALFAVCGTLDVTELTIPSNLSHISAGVAFLVGIALFFAATGKSAQFPLFTWLPDAMAGPTPVSALIHAATMVTAGVYVTSRLHPLLEMSPEVMAIIVWTGLATALIAGTIALVQNDIKKVLAYSTVSQLGFMFLAIGCGYYSVAMFHVVTHAFFKACLFLSAGSVIHGCHHEQDMRRMGGLAKSMPITAVSYGLAGLAIAGIAPLSGYFSKHAILEGIAFTSNVYIRPVHESIEVLASLIAILTSLYMARSFFMTFLGTYRGSAKPHEVSVVMWFPVGVLALLSLVGGIWLHDRLFAFLGDVLLIPSFIGERKSIVSYFVESIPGLLGIVGAYFLFVRAPLMTEKIQSVAWMFQKLWERKYYLDELYEYTLVKPLRALAGFVADGLSRGCIERAGGGIATVVQAVGELARRSTTGFVGSYAVYMLLAIAILVGILI